MKIEIITTTIRGHLMPPRATYRTVITIRRDGQILNHAVCFGETRDESIEEAKEFLTQCIDMEHLLTGKPDNTQGDF